VYESEKEVKKDFNGTLLLFSLLQNFITFPASEDDSSAKKHSYNLPGLIKLLTTSPSSVKTQGDF
jgi:hypothetical protein